jgi:hypothetical protein
LASPRSGTLGDFVEFTHGCRQRGIIDLVVNLLAEDHSHADDGGRHRLVLEPYGYRWYRVGGLDYLLKRSDIDTDAAGKAAHPA